MILDSFITGFKARFPGHTLSVHEADAIAVIYSANPSIGKIEVQDDLHELIVFVGDFTHGHFDCYDESLTEEEQHNVIASDVLNFLSDVFEDKVEFYRGEHGGGGWRPAGTGPEQSVTWTVAGKV